MEKLIKVNGYRKQEEALPKQKREIESNYQTKIEDMEDRDYYNYRMGGTFYINKDSIISLSCQLNCYGKESYNVEKDCRVWYLTIQEFNGSIYVLEDEAEKILNKIGWI